MFYLNVFYHTLPGQREAFLREIQAQGIDRACRSEDGCLKYDYYRAAQNPDELLLVEIWESPAHQQAHTQTAHTQALQALKAKYVSDTEIKTFSAE